MIDARRAPYGALLLRVSMGVLFILHGLYIKAMVFGMAGAGKYFASLGLPDWFAWVVVIYETLGRLAGWSSSPSTDPRPASFPLSAAPFRSRSPSSMMTAQPS